MLGNEVYPVVSFKLTNFRNKTSLIDALQTFAFYDTTVFGRREFYYESCCLYSEVKSWIRYYSNFFSIRRSVKKIIKNII